jgi:dihydrofolate reductase
MRKIIVFNHMTLDGFFAGPNDELDWSRKDDAESKDLASEGSGGVDAYLFGRRTFEMMASYWPTPAAMEQNPIFAGILNGGQKIVFSKTLPATNWQPTRIFREINREAIMAWKHEAGGNMMIFGSGSIVQQFTALGLIDEYQLIVNPVILGNGKALFANTGSQVDLNLVESRVFRSGNVLLVYRPAAGQVELEAVERF